MAAELTGGCQCGGVRYVIRAAPLGLYACHCTDCQRQSGSAFALSMLVPRESVAITRGTPRTWLRRSESGREIACLFCGDCGTRLYHEPRARPQITVVKPGTLDQARDLRPVGHIWTSRLQAGTVLPPDALCYEGQPPDYDRLCEAWQAAQSAA